MTRWLIINHDNLFLIMLTNLCIAILPDAVMANTATHDAILGGVSIVKEVIRMVENREYRNMVSSKLFNYSQNIATDQFAKNLMNLLATK